MHRKLMDAPALRGPDIDPAELVHRRRPAFSRLGKLALCFDQILADLGAEILIDLDNLQLDLRHLAPRLGNRAGQLTTLTLETGRITFQGGQSAHRHEIFLKQRADTFEFLVDEINFLLLGVELPQIALDFLLKLRAAFPELCFLSTSGLSAQLKKTLLRNDGTSGFRAGFAGSVEQHLRKGYLIRAVPFALETRLTRKQVVEAFFDDRGICQRLGLVET